MEEEFENNVPFDLISKVIEGEASSEEVAQLDAWRKESEDNEKEYQNLAQIMSEVPDSMPQFNVNAAWEKVESKISQKSEVGSQKSEKRSSLKVMTYLAAACVAVLVGLFLFPSEQDVQSINYVAQNDGEVYWLPDSSKLTLNKGATVSYLNNFEGRFRKINFKGEAFFNIKRDTTKTFVIDMDGPTVTVLGTSFNIKTNADSIKVVVNSGKVSFTPVSPILNKTKKHIMVKGDAAVYNSKEKKIKVSEYVDPRTLFYATKTIVFKKTKMKEVVKILSAVYNQDIEIGCAALANESYNGRFKDESLSEVFEILSATMDVEVEELDGRVVLTQDVCH